MCRFPGPFSSQCIIAVAVTRVALGFNMVVGAEAKLEVPSHLGPLYEKSLGAVDATAVAGFLKKLKTVDC